MKPPQFMHDCDVCQFLGEYRDEHEQLSYDLYYCPRSDEGSIIARYGHRGFEYCSYPLNVLLYAGLKYGHPLVIAAGRQIKRWQGRV